MSPEEAIDFFDWASRLGVVHTEKATAIGSIRPMRKAYQVESFRE